MQEYLTALDPEKAIDMSKLPWKAARPRCAALLWLRCGCHIMALIGFPTYQPCHDSRACALRGFWSNLTRPASLTPQQNCSCLST